MSKATVKAHKRGLKNTLLWEAHTPTTTEDFYAYGVYLEDLCQEREAVDWYRKAAERRHIAAMFQLAMLIKKGWCQGDDHQLFRLVMEHDLQRNQGNAFFRLGKSFSQGLGTHIDQNAGWYWFKKALDVCEASDDTYHHLLYELSFYFEKGLAGIDIDKVLARKYLTEAHEKGCQEAIWELWRLFTENFSDFPLQRDYTEAWSFKLGRYLRAAEKAPCKAYLLRLSRFYEKGFPEDAEENRVKMQQLAKEYAAKAVCFPAAPDSSKGA